jgi:hypothetical protein
VKELRAEGIIETDRKAINYDTVISRSEAKKIAAS